MMLSYCVQNLPEEADVEELKNLFISVPGVMGIYMDDKFLGEGRSILVGKGNVGD